MLNILIVDDDQNLCECLLRLMPWEDMNCNIPAVVHNGLSAWELLQREKIDFVICDIKMPVMEGTQLAGLLAESGMRTKMVFLSAYEDFSVARQALKYGVTDYILKPINRESLDSLEKIIRGINQTKRTKEFSDKFFEEEYNRQIFDAISSQNISFLDEMFGKLEMLKDQSLLSAGMSVLHILYEYLCSLSNGKDRSMYDNLYKKWRTDLVQITNAEEKISYLRDQYAKQLGQTQTENENEHTVHQIKELVDKNYFRTECNVAWIADKLHMSSGYVGRVFNKMAGIGLSEYITDCRMKEACRLLANDTIPVSMISGKVGYMDANYFTKAFRAKMGMSPSEYRKKSNN